MNQDRTDDADTKSRGGGITFLRALLDGHLKGTFTMRAIVDSRAGSVGQGPPAIQNGTTNDQLRGREGMMVHRTLDMMEAANGGGVDHAGGIFAGCIRFFSSFSCALSGQAVSMPSRTIPPRLPRPFRTCSQRREVCSPMSFPRTVSAIPTMMT